MSQVADPELVDLTELDAEWDIPCDYAEQDNPYFCGGNPARWVAFAKCPACDRSGQRLLCTECKDLVTNTDGGCRCPFCEAIIVPFRHVFTRFEPLERAG